AEDAREGIAHGGRPRVDDDERARGIGGDELEEDALALTDLTRAVGAAVGEDALERLRTPHGGEEDVQESRSRHLELHHHRARGEIRANRIGDLPRRLLGDPGQGEGGIRRVVSVRFLARYFPRDVLQCGQPGFVQGVLHRSGQELRDGDRHFWLVKRRIAARGGVRLMIPLTFWRPARIRRDGRGNRLNATRDAVASARDAPRCWVPFQRHARSTTSAATSASPAAAAKTRTLRSMATTSGGAPAPRR